MVTSEAELYSWDIGNRRWIAVSEGTWAEMEEAEQRRYVAARKHAMHGAAFWPADYGVPPEFPPEHLGIEIIP